MGGRQVGDRSVPSRWHFRQPRCCGSSQGLLFPSPLREQELAQSVEAGHGQSLWRACVTWPPAPASFTLPGPAPSTHGAASSRAERRHEVGAVATLLSFF